MRSSGWVGTILIIAAGIFVGLWGYNSCNPRHARASEMPGATADDAARCYHDSNRSTPTCTP